MLNQIHMTLTNNKKGIKFIPELRVSGCGEIISEYEKHNCRSE